MTTIGVAIAVPEPWGEELRSYRASLGDSSADGIPTHITLLPPVQVASDDLPTVERHLSAVAARTERFSMHLRGTGTFRPVSPVVFVGVVEGISQCEGLAFAVREGPLATTLPFPYHPHVTVAHDLEEKELDRAFEELADFECEFEVGDFSLYAHRGGIGWEPVRDFRLQPASGREFRASGREFRASGREFRASGRE